VLYTIFLAVLLLSCKPSPFGRDDKEKVAGKALFEKDDIENYIKIMKSDSSWAYADWAKIEGHKKEYRVVNGSLQFVFETVYGWDKPRIFVECENKKRYKIIFNPDDPNALHTIASQLGLQAKEQDREIWALGIRVSKSGHTLRKKEIEHEWIRRKLENNQFSCRCDRDGNWPLDGVSTQNLAAFLERQYRKPVVDLTGLDGYWTLQISDKNGKIFPRLNDSPMPLDGTGLELKWEKVNTDVLVIEDIRK